MLGDPRSGMELGMARHELGNVMAGFRAGPWVAEHFSLYSSRSGRSGRIYTEEAAYGLTY